MLFDYLIVNMRVIHLGSSKLPICKYAFKLNELGGTRGPPLYFMKCPSKSGQEIGLEGAELIGNEPLHDMRGHVMKSFKTIP
jgi:hypothetical protein